MAERKVFVTKRSTFEACHHLPNYDGKCSRLHGHSYKLEVTVSGIVDYEHFEYEDADEISTEAMAVDFSDIKRVIDHCITDRYDHTNLNDHFNYPTAEIMAIHFFEILSEKINKGNTAVVSVRLWETEDSYAEYFGERVGDSK